MKRLELLASLIPPYQRFADIGCDHGYLIKYAFNYKVNYAQAIDNKKGPLNQAKTNLASLGNQVLFSLSDGLSQLLPDIECCVLAGLGGIAIKNIFMANLEKLGQIKRIITSPHKNAPEVRLFLSNNGFRIDSEQVIYEDGQYYEIIVFNRGFSAYNKEEIAFGPLNLRSKPPLWEEMWNKVYLDLKNNPHPEAIKKCEYLEKYVLKG